MSTPQSITKSDIIVYWTVKLHKILRNCVVSVITFRYLTAENVRIIFNSQNFFSACNTAVKALAGFIHFFYVFISFYRNKSTYCRYLLIPDINTVPLRFSGGNWFEKRISVIQKQIVSSHGIQTPAVKLTAAQINKSSAFFRTSFYQFSIVRSKNHCLEAVKQSVSALNRNAVQFYFFIPYIFTAHWVLNFLSSSSVVKCHTKLHNIAVNRDIVSVFGTTKASASGHKPYGFKKIGFSLSVHTGNKIIFRVRTYHSVF